MVLESEIIQEYDFLLDNKNMVLLVQTFSFEKPVLFFIMSLKGFCYCNPGATEMLHVYLLVASITCHFKEVNMK